MRYFRACDCPTVYCEHNPETEERVEVPICGVCYFRHGNDTPCFQPKIPQTEGERNHKHGCAPSMKGKK